MRPAGGGIEDLTGDDDPNSEAGVPGGTFVMSGGSQIDMEVIREGGMTAAGGAPAYERRVVCHEIGHALRLDHGNGMDDPAANGIMNIVMGDGPVGVDLRFIPAHLAVLRMLDRPQS